MGNVFDISKIDLETGPSMMEDLNRAMVNEAKPQYTEFFKIMSDADNLPVVFHCTAGKDRTGFGAALFLASLGVDRETIYRDYLLSVKHVERKYRHVMESEPRMAPLLTVRRSYLKAAFDEIDKRYGGVDRYLTEQLGVDLERMRAIYTE